MSIQDENAKIFICTNEECPLVGIEYPTSAPITCGGCGTYWDPATE